MRYLLPLFYFCAPPSGTVTPDFLKNLERTKTDTRRPTNRGNKVLSPFSPAKIRHADPRLVTLTHDKPSGSKLNYVYFQAL